jgi:hypothetical protein
VEELVNNVKETLLEIGSIIANPMPIEALGFFMENIIVK